LGKKRLEQIGYAELRTDSGSLYAVLFIFLKGLSMKDVRSKEERGLVQCGHLFYGQGGVL